MLTRTDKLKNYRTTIYSFFCKRKDAIMNLLDAISSFAHQSRSVVQLSEAHCFERKYSSITDAIADGLPHVDWKRLETHQFNTLFDAKARTPPCFLMDCTPNPRPFSSKLMDRTVTHKPNPAPGNKPICVGHQYSCVALLPDDALAHDKKWITPLSMRRVISQEKGNEIGLQQVVDHIKQFELENDLVISVGDSLYGTESCRILAGSKDNLVHVFRLNSKRNVYFLPQANSDKSSGRKKEYGAKMALSKSNTHPEPDQQSETARLARSGKIYKTKIDAWNNVILRGSKKYRSSKHPMTLVRIRMLNDEGEMVFNRPLWLAVFGRQRNLISLTSIYQYYTSRYNIEHFFRFGKHKLLLSTYQTADAEHEENWWRLCLVAYNQLYLAKSLVPHQIKPWEKYLPEFQTPNNKQQMTATPSQTQRGFDTLLEQIGTPAVPCVPRGKSPGRLKGQAGPVRIDYPIIFKGATLPVEINNQDSENQVDNSNPQKILSFLKSVRSRLTTFNISTAQFTQMLCNSS